MAEPIVWRRRDIVQDDFSGDRRAAVLAGALTQDAVVARAGEISAERIGDAAQKVLAATRAGVDESDKEWAGAVAAQQQADHDRDLEREVRARTQLRGHVDPVAQGVVNRIELEASQIEAEDALAAVRAAAAGDETHVNARAGGQFTAIRPAMTRWDAAARERGGRLLTALVQEGVPPAELLGAMNVRPGWLPGGMSVGEAVMDAKLDDHLQKSVRMLAAAAFTSQGEQP